MANLQATVQGLKKHPVVVTQRQAGPPSRSSPRNIADRVNQKLSGITKGTSVSIIIIVQGPDSGTKKRFSIGTSAGWKPYTMRAPVLCAVIAISLALAGVIEYLAQMSTKQGGLALSPSEDDIPQSVNIAYLYMPTTVAVLYSLLWTWIDLDIRRMQPWFELSRPGGAKGDQSLLLDYPFEFLAFVPISAWKRKHWPVFFAGVVMMLVFWTITPLQSAIFGKQAVTLTRSTAMSIRSGLIPVEDQAAIFDVSILNAAYGSTWYDQDLPEYTTAEYTVLPFSPVDFATSGMDETWTFNTTRYATDLDCWLANQNVVIESSGSGEFTFDNGEGCAVNISLSGGEEGHYAIQYIGYETNADLDWALHNTYCGSDASHQFLAIVGQGIGTGANATFGSITAMFCEPSYMKQEVSIAVDASTSKPVNSSLVELGSWTQLDDSLFNSSAFEYLLHTGFSSVVMDRDYPDNLILTQYAKMYDLNVSWPLTNMVGFAVGLQNGSLADLVDTTVLQESYAAAHKLIFSSAFSQLVSQTEELRTNNGVVKYTMYGIVISRPISIVVECLLAVVAILGALLLCAIARSKSNLHSDPDSTASLFEMTQKEETLLCHFSNMDRLSETAIHARISDDQFLLKDSDSTTGPTLHLLSAKQVTYTGADFEATRAQIKSIRPKELRPMVGVLFILVLGAAIGVLGYLKHQEALLHGMYLCSINGTRSVVAGASTTLPNDMHHADSIQVLHVQARTSKSCRYWRTTYLWSTQLSWNHSSPC